MEIVLKVVAAGVAVCLVAVVSSAVLSALWAMIRRAVPKASGAGGKASARTPSEDGQHGSGPEGGGGHESD